MSRRSKPGFESIAGPRRRSSPRFGARSRAWVQDALVPTNPNAALAKASVNRGLLGALSDEIPMEIDDEGYVVQFFVEALIVPAHQWNDVRSLVEFERDRSER